MHEARLRKYGRWAVVTGASDGLGRAMARELARDGINLVLCSRRRPILQELAAELMRREGIRAKVVAVDLGTEAGISTLLHQCDELDVGLLVAAAGFGTSGPWAESQLLEEQRMLRVNCEAVLCLTHAFTRRFVERGRGGIVLLSSLVAFQGVPWAAHYAATKAYVQTLAEALHVELSPHGVDVLASAPGPVHSGFAKRANMKMGFALPPGTVARATLAALGRNMTVRPGWLSKVLEWSLKLPRWIRVHIMRRVMGGMTAHQRLEQVRAAE